MIRVSFHQDRDFQANHAAACRKAGPCHPLSAALPEGVQMRQHIQARSDLVLLEKPFEMDTLLNLISQLLEEEN